MMEFTDDELRRHFPHSDIRAVQQQMLNVIVEHGGRVTLEGATGSGKTAVAIALLQAAAAGGLSPLFYIVPTKAVAEQINTLYPGVFSLVYGRDEYRCLYFVEKTEEVVSARESACYPYKDCPHRVDQETGETFGVGAEPCPYYQAKYQALTRAGQGKIILCTMAWFVINRLLVERWSEQEPAFVVIDEAHQMARQTRNVLEYEITDYHLARVTEIVRQVDPEQAEQLVLFRQTFEGLIKRLRGPSAKRFRLKQESVALLITTLGTINTSRLAQSLQEALTRGLLDPVEDRTAIKLVQDFLLSAPRLLHSLQYAVEKERKPLSYVFAYYYREDELAANEQHGKLRAQYHLVVKSYYVAPLIRLVCGENVMAMSATIGNPKIFGFETGITLPFHSLEAPFSATKARIFLPGDTANLAFAKRGKNDVAETFQRMMEGAHTLRQAGHRQLVLVTSEAERLSMLDQAQRHEVTALSYGNGMKAKDVARRFIQGEGDILVGTSSHYSEGLDLPRGVAPIIWVLRPDYPQPDSPEAEFEQERFSKGEVWALWNWRVMLKALQSRGRNIRSADDYGVTIFVSQQFRRFLFPSLPEWLKPAYDGKRSLKGVIDATIRFLQK